MRILDEDNDRALPNVTLYLIESEASELRDALESLLQHPEHHHLHVPSSDYQKEITVAIYRPDGLDSFDARSKMLIELDT